MKYIRLFNKQSDFVEELTNKRLRIPRLVYVKDTRRVVFGKMPESFIKIDDKENFYLGDETGAFIILKAK